MIAQAVGVPAAKVSYVAFAGGGPATAAILGNQVAAGVSGYGEFAEQIKAGKMRLLAISAPTRQPGIDAPTLKEQGVDVELANWRGVFAPPGVSDADRKAMTDLVHEDGRLQGMGGHLRQAGLDADHAPGDDFGKYISTETERIRGILKELGLA